ncbi:MAG: trigger factor [Aerococcus sp.]|nr:trigger factor [Aerococcus sp.]
MSVNYEEKTPNEGVLHFTVDQEEAQKALRQAYKRVKKDVSVPGFRKGKVNYQIFVKMFGEEGLYEDAINLVLPEAYPAALEAAEISQEDIVAQPKFDIEEVKPGADWKLSATIVTRPEVKLGDYKELKVPVQDLEVSDEEINDRLKAAQANLAELTLKDGEAEMGDTVVIDFEGFKDGKAFDGGKGENYSLELGSNSFIPGFEDQLVGVKEGDEKEINVTFPEDYNAEDLAGADATFKITVHEVKAKEVPELDDEFAKDVDEEVATLDELKEKYRKEIADAKESQAKDSKDDFALRQAVNNAEFSDVPQAMIDEEVDRQVDHYLNEMQRQGISPEMFFQITGQSRESLRGQYAEDADMRVKTNLLLNEVIKAENIEVSAEDLQAEMESLAKTYDLDVNEVKNIVTEDMLKHDISLRKAMDIITESAVESADVHAEETAE